jgi:hypothetical protein
MFKGWRTGVIDGAHFGLPSAGICVEVKQPINRYAGQGTTEHPEFIEFELKRESVMERPSISTV